jgi:2-C-methyl-D-erythritol 4-phosphate cytidylyltransferase
VTDDAQLVEALGNPVAVVTGSPQNIKLTTKADFTLADAILKAKEGAKPKEKMLPRFDDEAKW